MPYMAYLGHLQKPIFVFVAVLVASVFVVVRCGCVFVIVAISRLPLRSGSARCNLTLAVEVCS